MAVALALALLGPGPLVSPSPGGDEGSRSTPDPPNLLMVNVNETTCLCPARVGGVFAGTDGGGIARWTEDGTLATLHTMGDGGIATNHIVDIVPDVGVCLAIGDTPEPLVYATGAIGDRWFTLGDVPSAQGPLRALEGNADGFLVLDAEGGVFLSGTGVLWSRLDPEYGLPDAGWAVADRDGDILALSNGTDVVLVDLSSPNPRTIEAPPLVDIDLSGDVLAIAGPDHPDAFDIRTGTWLDDNVTDALRGYGQGWALVRTDGSKFTSATLDGLVIEANVSINDPGDLKLQGTLSDEVDANVTDMLLLANETVLLSTMRGLWVLRDGEASPFPTSEISMPPSNDILSVSYEADTLWVLTPEGLAFLSFDSRGHPTTWTQGPYLGEGATTGMLDTAYLEGRVYICGYGSGVHTYDTFASSAVSRWDRVHIYGDARDDVTDVAVVDGVLHTGGPYGVDSMTPGTDPPEFQLVGGAPSGVLCLQTIGTGLLYVGTDQGLWGYEPGPGEWEGPDEHMFSLPEGPVSDIAYSGAYLYFAIGTVMASPQVEGLGETVVFIKDGTIERLGTRDGVADPTWAVVEGRAFAYEYSTMGGYFEPERRFLGDSWVHDLVVSSDGVAYLGTDSGLHRIDRYGAAWYEWTTSNGLSANDIRTLAYVEDTEDLWVGAYGGVDVMDVDTEGITRIGVEDGIPSNLVYDVELEGTSVWIGTDVGGAAFAELDHLVWSVYNSSTGVIADDVQSVAVWGDHVLFGTDEGVTVLDRVSSTFQSYTAASSGLPHDWVWCSLSVDEGIYVGTDGGLALYDPGDESWRQVAVEQVAGHHVRSLVLDPEDRLWVGTEEGLRILTMDQQGEVLFVNTVDLSDGLPGEEVLAIEQVSDGTMWVGTSAGAAVLSIVMGVKSTFTTDDGLVHDRVTAIEEGPDRTIWLGTAGGLSRLQKHDWDLLPQWTTPRVDIPDVYVTLDDVVIEPEAPNEGDEVQVRVTVSNPSGKRAIVHIGLFGDLDGAPGEELSGDIAYTEPGSSYQVTLTWTAVGGEHNLWVVADPDDLVPESNERNNVVAISIHVNHPPMFVDPTVRMVTAEGAYPKQRATASLQFTYKDIDGHPVWPMRMTTYVPETGEANELNINIDEPRTGHVVRFSTEVPLGNSSVIVEITDGSANATHAFNVSINMGGIRTDGLEKYTGEKGSYSFSLEVLEPWDGSEIVQVNLDIVPAGSEVWSSEVKRVLSVQARGEGDAWKLRSELIPDGDYDIWVLAEDDRGVKVLEVVEGVTVDNDGGESLGWTLLIVVMVVAVIMAALLFLLYSRRRKGGDAD